jgi:hypothetical protein
MSPEEEAWRSTSPRKARALSESARVRFYVKWADLKKSAEWRAEATFARGTPEFERLRRNYLMASAMEAYGYVAIIALIVLCTMVLLIAILDERFG